MLKFKINNQVKRSIAREVKIEIANYDYMEIAIMYNPTSEEFYTTSTFNIDKDESEGNIHYQTFSHSAVDGKLTLLEIENKIFS